MLMAKKTTKVSTKRVKRAFEVVLDSVVIGTFKKENIPTRVVKIARVHRSGFKELDYLFVVKKSTNIKAFSKSLACELSHYGVYVDVLRVANPSKFSIRLNSDEVAYIIPYVWSAKDKSEIALEREAVSDALKRSKITKKSIESTNEVSFYNWESGILEKFKIS